MSRIHLAIGITLLLLRPLSAQESLVGTHELEPGLVHPLILPQLPAGRAMDGLDLGLHESMPLSVTLRPGKRVGEYRMTGKPKLGKTRLIMPGLINAKLQYYDSRKFRRLARFQINESIGGALSIKNHCGSLGQLGDFEITFVDLDHDGALGTSFDGYVVKAPKQKQWIATSGGIDLRRMAEPIVIEGSKYWLECDPPGFELLVTDKEPDFAARRQRDYEGALDYLNGLRARLGHRPVALDEGLSAACLEHALYCARHGLTHEQDPNKPGYSETGAKAGQYSELTYARSMHEGLRRWQHTFYHRVEMLGPNLTHVGMGLGGGVAALDAQSSKKRGTFTPYGWPPDGAEDVPCRWQGGEWPSPTGVEPFDAKVARGFGYPVSLTFPTFAVEGVEAKLRCGKQEFEVFVTSPQKPGNPALKDNVRSILVMSTTPLPPSRVIEVEVRCLVAKQPFSKSWSFKTARK